MRYVLRQLQVGPLGANCYILGCARTKEAVIIDPGGDAGAIRRQLERDGLKAKCVINTHGHFDHIGANAELGLPVYAHKADAVASSAATCLKEGDIIKAGDLSLEVIHTPGHSPGGICLKAGNMLFSGDTLFAGSVGRTDMPGGSGKQLDDSLKKLVAMLADGTEVYPGHGPSTTIGQEKEENPFL
ncbi:MAG: MBL fold metallo-hydrolase [Candidatus Omnitrophota bacterium]